MEAQRLIYGLIDPRDGQLRYVGKSSAGLRRPRSHIFPSALKKEHTHKAYWLRRLIAAGLQPEIEVLETAPADIDDAEKFWIAYFKSIGCNLTNLTEGGEGVVGLRHSAAARAKMSAVRRGVPKSPEWRAKIAASNRGQPRPWLVGRPKSPEERAKLSAANKGRRRTPEQIAKHAAAIRGRKHTPEHIEKVRLKRIGCHHTAETKQKQSISIRTALAEKKRERALQQGQEVFTWH